MRPLLHSIGITLIAAGLLQACGEGPSSPIAATPSSFDAEDEPTGFPSIGTIDDTGPVAGDWLPASINGIAHSAEIAVVGEVTDLQRIEPPRPGQMAYYQVTLETESAIFSDGTTPETIRYLQLDPGTRPDDVIGGIPAEVPVHRRYGPELAIGDRLVVLLSHADLRGFDVDVLHPSHGYQSTWLLEGDLAVSVDPRRTVLADALIQRIQAERESPYVTPDDADAFAEAQLTTRNPLGEEPPIDTIPISTDPLPVEPDHVPQIVEGAETLAVDLQYGDVTYSAVFGRSDTGGVAVKVYSDGVQIGGMGGPTPEVLEGMSTTTFLPDGEVVLAMVGAPGLNPEDIEVIANGEVVTDSEAATWVWADERPILVTVVPTGTEHVEVHGIVEESAVDLTLPADPSLVLQPPTTEHSN